MREALSDRDHKPGPLNCHNREAQCSSHVPESRELCNHVGREKEVLDASTEGREKSSQSAHAAPNL